MNQSCYAIKDKFPFYTHQLVLNIIDKLKSEPVGATFSALVTRDFESQFLIDFPETIKCNFNKNVLIYMSCYYIKIQENQKLTNYKVC